ncbi:MAG: hypothetical protein JSV05_03485 [Candidatus Bathyarchaeota archaeon]|nr:MAG: hypothetical protein JSV05_03485 [Candidatus Bathyarchaeota archaeon]
MPKKKKKKLGWKERQRQRQLKQQKELDKYYTRREIEAETKPRKCSKGKILAALCLIAIILGSYGAWQYTRPSTQSEEPPPINPTNPLLTPYDFTMRDIDGTQFSLNSFSGRIIVIHLMGVGCQGQINPINEYQLTQLKTVCSSYCGNNPVTLITVAVATCENSDLAQIRINYDIAWLFGNDYDDGKVDIAQQYAAQGDGTIVLIDKAFQISEAYSTIAASTLSSKINQLLGA